MDIVYSVLCHFGSLSCHKVMDGFPGEHVLGSTLIAHLYPYVGLHGNSLLQITWLLIALLWGTLRLLSTRNSTIDQNNDILQENSWGFGQCLSTAMVLLLLFSGIETYLGELLVSDKFVKVTD
jgi:hypothetical protein